jgi:RNA polymerase sigma-70 factor (ECF subfamily)
MSIVANKSRDWVRREQSRRGVVVATQQDGRAEIPPDQRLERVKDGLSALEPEQRDVLRRHYLESRSVAEIASELGIPEGTVKSRLHAARHQLRLRLEED